MAADSQDRGKAWVEAEAEAKAQEGSAFALSAGPRLLTVGEPRALSTPVQSAAPRWSAHEILLGKKEKKKGEKHARWR